MSAINFTLYLDGLHDSGWRHLVGDTPFSVAYEMGEEDAITLRLPSKVEVCWACEGRGTTSSHSEPRGGGFTGQEFDEMCRDDPDFIDDYRSGVYDRACESCKGRNVVDVIDFDQLGPLLSDRIFKQMDDTARDAAEDRRTLYYESGGMDGSYN